MYLYLLILHTNSTGIANNTSEIIMITKNSIRCMPFRLYLNITTYKRLLLFLLTRDTIKHTESELNITGSLFFSFNLRESLRIPQLRKVKIKMELIREINDKYKIKDATSVYEKYLKEFGNEDREYFIVIGLDTKNKAIYREVVGIGTLNSCLVSPVTTFKKAIMMSCNAIIIAHNHPSQDLTPSEEDKQIYKELQKAGEILEIKVLDSIIFGKDESLSLNEEV